MYRSKCPVVRRRAPRSCRRTPRDPVITTRATVLRVPAPASFRSRSAIVSCWAPRACRNPAVQNSPLSSRPLIIATEELALGRRVRHFHPGCWNRLTVVSVIRAAIMLHLICKVITARPTAPTPPRGWGTATPTRPADDLKVIFEKYRKFHRIN